MTTKFELDADGYPTEATLAAIAAWPIKDYLDCATLLGFVAPYFCDHGYCTERQATAWQGSALRKPWVWALSTGGWAGCEDLVGAMQRNTMFWTLCWWQHRRGGHYEFERKWETT